MRQRKINNIVINYRENSADELVLEHSFENDIFLSSIPYYRIRNRKIILDVGAHIGTFSLFLSQRNKSLKIFAFEPSEKTFDVLKMNILENNLANVIIPLKIALYDKDSEVKLYHDEESGNWGHSIVCPLSNTYEDVKTLSMDTFFDGYGIKKCDLIKFNCEGAEFKIISSMSDKVLNSIKTWIILYHEDIEKNGNHKEILKRLKKNQFITNHIRVSDDNKRGWITATKNYKDYFHYSVVNKILNMFRSKRSQI